MPGGKPGRARCRAGRWLSPSGTLGIKCRCRMDKTHTFIGVVAAAVVVSVITTRTVLSRRSRDGLKSCKMSATAKIVTILTFSRVPQQPYTAGEFTINQAGKYTIQDGRREGVGLRSVLGLV